jgi:hypothetical protein
VPILRHPGVRIAELPDDLSVREIARAGVASAAERDRADMTFLARQRFPIPHMHGPVGVILNLGWAIRLILGHSALNFIR